MAEKTSCFEMKNFWALNILTKLFEYFQNKGIDSNNTLQKRQNTNGSIKEQLFLSRESKKLYFSHREKKEGTSIWNAWVLLVFVLLHDSNFIMETEVHTEAALQFLHHLSWSCFVNTKWFPLSQRAPS